jgi:hypothetical protein
MVINHLFQSPSFNPEEINSMAQAFEAVCSALQMPKLDDDLARFVAAKIIAACCTGSAILNAFVRLFLQSSKSDHHGKCLAAARGRDAKPIDTQTQRLEFQQDWIARPRLNVPINTRPGSRHFQT